MAAKGAARIELTDVMAVVADASALALDGVIDAAFAGRTAEVETEFSKARAGGSSPAAIVSAAIRQVSNLHKMKLAVEGGDSIEFAMKRGAPPVHFTREAAFRQQVSSWPAEKLEEALTHLYEAEALAKTTAVPAEAVAGRALLSVAAMARTGR